jgi:hypothetical protein
MSIYGQMFNVLAEKKQRSPYFGGVRLPLHCSDNSTTPTQESEIDRFLNSIINGSRRIMAPLPRLCAIIFLGLAVEGFLFDLNGFAIWRWHSAGGWSKL